MYFIDLEGRVSFAYVPVRDQNLVVRGWNWRLICFCVFLVFENGFKMKKPSGKWELICVFWYWRKLLEVELNRLMFD